jgi:conjugal transfer pilus assembly protein TraV
MKKIGFFAAIGLSAAMLSGCGSMMNIGESEFSCPGNVENGYKCMNVRDLYKATDGPSSSIGKKLPTPGADSAQNGLVKKLQPAEVNPVGHEPTPWMDKPLPIRSQAKVMRVWVAPYEDEVGDLNAPGLVYTEIESRRWNVGEGLVRRPTRLAPIQVPGQQGASVQPDSGATQPFAVSNSSGQAVSNLKNVTPGANGKQQPGALPQQAK